MKKNSKFRLTDETMTMEDGTEVTRIEAMKDFNNVRVGDLGGFIEKEANLGFEEDDVSWVYDDSVVYGDSELKWNSLVGNGSSVKDSNVINGSRVLNDAVIENSHLQGPETTVAGGSVDNSKVYSSELVSTDVKDSEIVFSSMSDSEINKSFVESTVTTNGSSIENSHIEDEDYFSEQVANLDTRLQIDDSDLEDLNELDDGLTR